MASLRRIYQYSFLALLVSLTLSRETSAYYSGHHYQHQHQPRHLSSHRHQMTHRSSQSHFALPSSSTSGARALPPLPPPPQSPSPKYPNLDRLLHRLDAEAGKSEALVATASPSLPTPRRDSIPSFLRPTVPPPLPATPMPFTTPTPPHRHRHHQEEFYDDELDEDDEVDDEEDGRAGYHQNAQRDSKLPWDVKFNEDANYQRQQAAGGGGGGLSLGAVSGTTSFSERKWQVLGNRQNLDEYRRRKVGNYRPSSSESEIREAVQHALKVSREGSCKVPRPKVIQVKDIYPHPSKTYIPHCTILHQCGDDTGCCRHETLACVPRSTHRVELHFYTTTFGSYHGNMVEKLVFYNHTECECQDKMEEMMPRDPAKNADVGVRHFRQSSNGGRIDTFGPAPLRSYRGDRTPEPPPTRSCKCPSLYSARYPSDGGSCQCDCFDKQRECIKAKRGKEYFSLQDRLCIQSEECLSPTCEFGIYLRRAGRCPRKREKFAAWQRYTLDEYK